MWCVIDKDGNKVAWIEDDIEAECFKEVYYPDGRFEFIRVTIVEEDE